MSFADKVSSYNRARKWSRFLEIINPTSETRVLDVGVNAKEYSDVDNYMEKNYDWPEMITALGINDLTAFQERYPKVKAVRYDGKYFPFVDKEFDLCWSNAVIEHVGGRDEQILFLKEIARVARRGFITTPNRLFPIEVHTRTLLLHLLPKAAFDWYLSKVRKKWATGRYMSLLSKNDLKQLLEAAGISNYRIIGNRLGLFCIDYIVVFESAE